MPLQLPIPHLPDPAAVPALAWGVVGTGIADAFVSAIHAHTTQRAVAVTARDPAKTAAFASRHGIPTVHADLDALLADPRIDVVYIATPHTLHREQALAAIEAGKHVLVEKPIGMTADDARAVRDAAATRGVLAMEAMWTHYLPQLDIVRRLMADGALGDIHLVTADFGFVAPLDRAHRLWNPQLGGGALLDAGVYPISFARSVLGPVASVSSTGTVAATGVDERAALTLVGAGGRIAQLATSLSTVLPMRAAIQGSRARVEVMSPFFRTSGIALSTGLRSAQESVAWEDPRFAGTSDGLSYQATALASYVGDGVLDSPVHPLDHAIDVLEIIDGARAQILRGVDL
jgi:predicted dehydrogenase